VKYIECDGKDWIEYGTEVGYVPNLEGFYPVMKEGVSSPTLMKWYGCHVPSWDRVTHFLPISIDKP